MMFTTVTNKDPIFFTDPRTAKTNLFARDNLQL